VTRKEGSDSFDGSVQIVHKADRRRKPIEIPVKATLINHDELQITYLRWPTFNHNGIRQSEDTKTTDSIKRVSDK